MPVAGCARGRLVRHSRVHLSRTHRLCRRRPALRALACLPAARHEGRLQTRHRRLHRCSCCRDRRRRRERECGCGLHLEGRPDRDDARSRCARRARVHGHPRGGRRPRRRAQAGSHERLSPAPLNPCDSRSAAVATGTQERIPYTKLADALYPAAATAAKRRRTMASKMLSPEERQLEVTAREAWEVSGHNNAIPARMLCPDLLAHPL